MALELGRVCSMNLEDIQLLESRAGLAAVYTDYFADADANVLRIRSCAIRTK